jgi:hypothetical protein
LNDVAKAFKDYYAMILAANQLALERTDEDALKLIQLRRDLAQKTIDVQRAVDEFLRASGINEVEVPLVREHRALFSAERRSVSQHQAKWNAPAMRANRDSYEADVRALFKMHEDNHHWRLQILVPALDKTVVRCP